MPHICMDEVMLALAALPVIGGCARCLLRKLKAMRGAR